MRTAQDYQDWILFNRPLPQLKHRDIPQPKMPELVKEYKDPKQWLCARCGYWNLEYSTKCRNTHD